MTAPYDSQVHPGHLSGGRTAIVGGGLLGLTLALRLAQAGDRVTVFEASPELGGLASTQRLGDVTWDRHYHVTLFSDARLRGFLAELGLEDEVRWSSVGTGFYCAGRFFAMNGLLDFLRFPPLGLIDKLRLGLTILRGAGIADGRPLEALSVETWLTRWSGRTTFEKIWRPLLRAKLGDRYREASAAFIWAIIARLYRARRAGLGAERFGYVAGGYARILDVLVQRLRARDVELVTDARVTTIRAEHPGALEVAFATGDVRDFARVVVTVVAPLAAKLIPELEPGERERLASKRYGGIVCASLLLDEPLGPYYVTNLIDAWVPFSAVIDMAALVDRAAWNGNALIYLPKYVAPDDPLFACADAEIEATFLAALERMYPKFSKTRVRAFAVSRVREVFPIATLNYSQSIPTVATSIPGLFTLNSAQIVNGTLNVDETLGLVDLGIAAMHAAASARPA